MQKLPGLHTWQAGCVGLDLRACISSLSPKDGEDNGTTSFCSPGTWEGYSSTTACPFWAKRDFFFHCMAIGPAGYEEKMPELGHMGFSLLHLFSVLFQSHRENHLYFKSLPYEGLVPFEGSSD